MERDKDGVPIAYIIDTDAIKASNGGWVRLLHVECPYCGSIHVHHAGYAGHPLELIYAYRVSKCKEKSPNDQGYVLGCKESWGPDWIKMFFFVVEGHRKGFPEDERSTSEIFKFYMDNWVEAGMVKKNPDGSYEVPHFLPDTENGD